MAAWRLLSWTGISPYAVYYAWTAASYVAGLFLAAFVLNRTDLRRSIRNAALVAIAVFTLLPPIFGVYSALRFLLPYALLLAVMARLRSHGRGIVLGFVAVGAVVLAAAVSPEMGGALLVALGVAFGVMWARLGRGHAAPLVVLLTSAAVVGIAASTQMSATAAAFAAGAYYLPVLPGLPALAFVGTMLLLAWGTGERFLSAEPIDAAVQLGWLALAVVLIVPALGRADVVHLFWNGLGAIIGGLAIVDANWSRGRAYAAFVLVAFSTVLVAYTLAYFVPTLVGRPLRTQRATLRAAAVVHGGREAWLQDWEKRHAADVGDRAAAAAVPALGDVTYAAFLRGETGEALAKSGRLLPLYGPPQRALTFADFERSVRQLDGADTLLVPKGELFKIQAAAKDATPSAKGVVMRVPEAAGTPVFWGSVLGVRVSLKGRHPVFDPLASFGAVLKRDWVRSGAVGDYAVFVRRDK